MVIEYVINTISVMHVNFSMTNRHVQSAIQYVMEDVAAPPLSTALTESQTLIEILLDTACAILIS